MIRRVYVEKRKGFDVKAQNLQHEIKEVLGADVGLRFFVRYDFEGKNEDFEKALNVVFSEPPADIYYLDAINAEGRVLCVEFLPGQYDQRADSAAQCVSMLTGGERPFIKCASVYVIEGAEDAEFEKIKRYFINPVETRECGDDLHCELKAEYPEPPPEETVDGFVFFGEDKLKGFYRENGFAFTFDDLKHIQTYFKTERRDPFWAELKVLDTYWSDHCRHTTFNAELTDIKINSPVTAIKKAYNQYVELFNKHYGKESGGEEGHKHSGADGKKPSLMNIATIAARDLSSRGLTPALDESEEINACTIRIKADANGRKQDWTVMFKNETHNHPTEIEPFGGAATCLGGAIRDPLAGRVYVYQSMRISGASDILRPLEDTMEGKLPQRVLSKRAAAGFSSYGNQIGLATGAVHEIYHPGYAAKRLEAGFVVGAAPSKNIVRKKPAVGDAVLLIGGRTGRDGLGGATGSSKAHDVSSLTQCGAEVQKGNPLTERKLQRLFRNPDFARLVKRCNDFGAGGVSVAVGELADSLEIDLDRVPKKYAGLSGTELAIAESQERMAVVLSPHDVALAVRLCGEENLEATKIADITGSGRLRMRHKGRVIVDLKRAFLDTNGVRQSAKAEINDICAASYFEGIGGGKLNHTVEDREKLLCMLLSDYNCASQKGMIEMFDSTVGAATVLMPLGGKNQLSPSCAIAAKLPMDCETTTATVAAYGFDPYLSFLSPFLGAVYATLTAVVKAAVSGADYDGIYLTNQEFFEKLRGEPARWGKPAAALLGALHVQLAMQKAAIGGKDSMSGSFGDLDVPPTLVCFALGIGDARFIVGGAASSAGIDVYRYKIKKDGEGMPDFADLTRFLKVYQRNLGERRIDFVTVCGAAGAAAALVKSLLGFDLGFAFESRGPDMFTPSHGDVIFGVSKTAGGADNLESAHLVEMCEFVGRTDASGTVSIGGQEIALDTLKKAYTDAFEGIYPTFIDGGRDNGTNLGANGGENNEASSGANNNAKIADYRDGILITRPTRTPLPKVFIPVFPGTNCEYDTARAFEKAGAAVDIFVIKNGGASLIAQSVEEIKKRLKQANILMLPGGFSGGDEPDGSGKFICSMLQNAGIAEEISALLYKRGGLALGICNGFQALIKLGLLPYGRIEPLKPDSPTLTFNSVNRHVSQIVKVRVSSNLSPWLSGVKVGAVFNQAVSHGEGRFVAGGKHLAALVEVGQIATQYADFDGRATVLTPHNPNGSVLAVEGITSPDGRILGKMGHSERAGRYLYKNADDTSFDMKIFESGMRYFK
ncbi:MAG: phosphoribosylformylglycinamidine synthase [Firmicutes bacterium]|nr:phosphoribosylformylglycinamidine synthase [Bacillota bacterium]